MALAGSDFAEVVAAWREVDAEMWNGGPYASTDVAAAVLILAMQVNEAATRLCDRLDALTESARLAADL